MIVGELATSLSKLTLVFIFTYLYLFRFSALHYYKV